MNICSWNVRGMNDPSKVVEIKKFLSHNNVSVVALVETKVKVTNSEKVQKKFGNNWRWVMNYTNSPRGRVWIDQMIHGCITAKKGKFSTSFTVVYGLHSIDTRKSMWTDLTQLSSVTLGSWLVMGDFNSVLYSGDRANGNAVNHAETRDFEGNKGQGQSRICSRIDKVFGNTDWHSTFLDVVVDYMNPGISDHPPLVLSCNINMKTGGRPFKFFNYMAEHGDFMKFVQEGWNVTVSGTPMFTLWQKMKAIKGGLKVLHHRDFARLEEKIALLRQELDGIQTQLATSYTDNHLQNQEKECDIFPPECSLKLKKFLKVQESSYKQKSRIQWLKEGDANTKFFFSAMKEMIARNSIDVLYSATGEKLESTDAIKEEIKGFYVNLIVRKGNQLSSAAAEDLIQPVTNLEIDAALKGIDSNKAPGIDGFNSLFFKKTWGIVKEDVYAAVKHFFLTGNMLKQVNNTV
ncbi:uncharacterized protein [Spinacia oleracea]|uniref:Endonuclease/exonuclease/phosphatase domain-containing protein n=1 Tax=Spinacia oleracea TaxID=3562 RepID=A0ABM3RR33_SPIOL|nr:uncharacterized protein LOC110788212 [Spinacia oleracea]